MSPSLVTTLASAALLAAMLAQTATAASPQKLAKRYVGSDFETEFNYFDDADPTNGFVNYVSKSTAKTMGLIQSSSNYFKMKVDDQTPVASGRGRSAVRIVSKDEFADGVYVLDLDHMPVGCGTWPAWWTTTVSGWPKGGEIDIIEGSNAWPVENSYAWTSTFGANTTANLTAAPLQTTEDTASLHTIPTCNIEQTGLQTGVQVSTTCDATKNDNQGCGVELGTNTWGANWNNQNGGYYVLHRDFSKSRTISVYTFARTASNTPSELSDSSSATLDPTSWGITPQAQFTIPQCTSSTFNAHVIVFNIALCGDLAANTFTGNGCPGVCKDFVANNPGAFADAWWGIRSMRVYNEKGAPVEDGMRPWVAALISVASIAIALLGTVGLLYYVFRKRRGHNHAQHVELVESEGMEDMSGKGGVYTDDPDDYEGGRRPSGHGPFIDVPVDDNRNRQSMVGSNRNSQLVGSRRSMAGNNSNRNSTIGGNRQSQYDDNRVSMFSFSAPNNRLSAYSAVGAQNANSKRSSRVFTDPRANQGPLKVGDGGTVPRAPTDIIPGETPVVSSMKQYNSLGGSLGVNQNVGSSRAGSKSSRNVSPSTSHQGSRRGSASGGQPTLATSSKTATPRSARRARINNNSSNRSSVISDSSTTPVVAAAAAQPASSSAMDRKSSWDSQVGQNLTKHNKARRASADESAGEATGGEGWGTDDEK